MPRQTPSGGLCAEAPLPTSDRIDRKEVSKVEWITPEYEEIETEAEVTAYVDHWLDVDEP